MATATRMHCGDCGNTDFADTWLEGSDALEWLGWTLGGLAGWLYCAWRHALRRKRCAHCGGEALIREARAACERASWPVPPHFGGQVDCATRTPAWPASLRDPRQRLRSGLPLLIAWCLAALGFPQSGAGLALAWLAVEALRAVQHPPPARRCRAWNAGGQSLRVELV